MISVMEKVRLWQAIDHNFLNLWDIYSVWFNRQKQVICFYQSRDSHIEGSSQWLENNWDNWDITKK